MKKIKKSHSIYITPIRLFLEDIQTIEDIYKQYCKSFTIKTDDYVLDTTAELKEINKEKISRLSFESFDPHIHVDLSECTARIYSRKDDPNSLGIVAKLKEVLDKRVTSWRFIFSSWIMIPAQILLWVFYWTFLCVNSLSMISGLTIIPLIMVLWYVAQYRFKSKKHTIIYIVNKKNLPNFFRRNKDQIVLVVISAIVGGIISFFLFWITGALK